MGKQRVQLSIFDVVLIDERRRSRLRSYTKEQYLEDVRAEGVEKTWDYICEFLLHDTADTPLLSAKNIPSLYEEGLAVQDKRKKKSSGQYFTPDDVSSVMAQWLERLPAENLCDVGCGTGTLIFSYFERIGEARARELIAGGRLYLYENDRTALKICMVTLLLKYGREYEGAIHAEYCDFLDRKTKLPENCKVIANPPYSAFDAPEKNWGKTKIQRETRELYAAFFEKIVRHSARAVIITPYSFIGGRRFYPLRALLCRHNGFIVSFDNVPGNIFHGKKHGVFNTNTSNSVRAAITVVENREGARGFRLSPLIRFKSEERERLLRADVLGSMVSARYQRVDKNHPMFAKCDASLEPVWELWKQASDGVLGDRTGDGDYKLYMPNTCRYYTVAARRELTRKGQIELSFSDKRVCDYVFCMLNSSFAYWYWRLFDGGITYPKSLLLSLPLFFGRLREEDHIFFAETAEELSAMTERFLVHKKNVGVQENIKYPRAYRDAIDNRLLSILGADATAEIFDRVHANSVFGGDE